MFAFGSLALILAFFTFAEYYFSKNLDKMSSLINISGRQRMLSQRTAFLATSLMSQKKESDLEKLQTSLKLFEESHNAILRGDKDKNLPEHDFKKANALYFDQGLERLVRLYIENLNTVVRSFENRPIEARESLKYIQTNFDSLLVSLNKVVNLYEEVAIEKNETFIGVKILGFSLFLFLFFYQYRFIFSPLASKLSLGFSELEKTSKMLDQKSKEALKLSEAKSDFLANMSHELRTPMNGILGMSDLLSLTKLNDEQKEMVDTIRTSGSSLLLILNDVLDFSKIEKGKFTLEYLTFDLRKMIKDIVELTRANKGSRKIQVTSSISEEIPRHFEGDAHRIRQILLNFLSNAIKFTDEGLVKLVVSGEEVSDGAQYELHFSVVDSGIGIKEEDLQKLFKDFSQVDETISRKYGGTGLGLSISSNLARLMNGRVEVESAFRKGSTFSLILTLDVIENYQFKEVNDVTTDGFAKEYPHKILVVEDNKINQKLALMVFKKLGYEITFANNGKEALSILIENSFSIVFMDIQMPIMDGLTCTKEVFRSQIIDPDKTKIVAMTANAFQEDKEKCLNAGMVDFISKPIDLSLIKEVLMKYR